MVNIDRKRALSEVHAVTEKGHIRVIHDGEIDELWRKGDFRSMCELASCLGITKARTARAIFFANVPRQVSLAGGARESQRMGVKALGMLFCQHPLCLNAKSGTAPLESAYGQRLAGRACSAFCSFGKSSFKVRWCLHRLRKHKDAKNGLKCCKRSNHNGDD